MEGYRLPAVIAKVRLAKGELGFIDELSGIYLNWANPEQEIYAGTNCTGLRRGVKARRIVLTAGSLGRTPTFKEILHKIKPPEPEPIYNTDDKKKPGRKKKAAPEPVVEEPVQVVEEEPVPIEEPKEEAPIIEEPAPVVEEVKDEEEISITETETTEEEAAPEDKPIEEAPVETPKKKRKKKG